ncbi:diguanylate cyclase domain-containing protein [Desulfovibrio caledoniensis]
MFFKSKHPTDQGKPPGEDHAIPAGGIRIFLVLLLVVLALLALGGTLLYHVERNDYLDRLGAVEVNSLDRQSGAISRELDHLAGDILYLSKQNELLELLDSGGQKAFLEMEREYLQLVQFRQEYDQIRFLDKSGRERIRVNWADGSPQAVPQSRLQDKGTRYYFKESFALGNNDIFLSPMDLNMEHQKVEVPFRPMLRVGTPVFDSLGRKRGIVLINYNARNMQDRILAAGDPAEGLTMLLDCRGYWLLSPDKNQEWGFMFPDKLDVSFARLFPDEWGRMKGEDQGQFLTANGLYTFLKVSPLADMQVRDSRLHSSPSPGLTDRGNQSYSWTLISWVPTPTLDKQAHTLLFKLFIGGGALLALIGFGAWHLAMAVSRRRLYQEQLEEAAMFDALTGLPNRKLFFDRLNESMSLSVRYERRLALLYIDLDGFKAVNDTLGHEAGDEVLKRVSALLIGLVRHSDTVARLGGDEFVVMLNEVANVGDAALVGEKLVSALRAPFSLREGPAAIGASVGVSVYPEHGTSADVLIQKADQAMYVSKHKGKNTCTMADSSRCADA